MPEISRTFLDPKVIDVSISEINDGIHRVAGLVNKFGITYNQFLIDDERPILIHTGPIGLYKKIEESKGSNTFAEVGLRSISSF
jgi:hypothetical protein